MEDIEFNIEQDLTNVFRLLQEYAEQFKVLYTQKLTADNRKATGQLLNSISTNVNIGNLVYTVTLDAVGYYKYVEEGRKKGKFPPPEAIMKWIQAKPILPRPMANGKLPTTKQLAFLIGRSIAEKGTIKDKGYTGGKYIAQTTQELNAHYLPLLQEALEKDFDAYSIRIYDHINKTVRI